MNFQSPKKTAPRTGGDFAPGGTEASDAKDDKPFTPKKKTSFQAGATPTPRKKCSTGKSLKDRKQTPFKPGFQNSAENPFMSSASKKPSGVFTPSKAAAFGSTAFGAATQASTPNGFGMPNSFAKKNEGEDSKTTVDSENVPPSKAAFAFGASGGSTFQFPADTAAKVSFGAATANGDDHKKTKSTPFTFGGVSADSASTPLKSSEASSNPFLKQTQTGTSATFACAPPQSRKKPPRVETVEEDLAYAPQTTAGLKKPPVEKDASVEKDAPKTTAGLKKPPLVDEENGLKSKMPPSVDAKEGQKDGNGTNGKPPAKVTAVSGGTAEKRTTVSDGDTVAIDKAQVKDKSDESVAATIADVEESLITWKLLSYKDCSVEEILNMIRDELTVDAINFCEEAKELHSNEIAIRTMEQDLVRLTETMQNTMANQEDAFNTLTAIEAHQKVLESTLVTLEDQVDQMF